MSLAYSESKNLFEFLKSPAWIKVSKVYKDKKETLFRSSLVVIAAYVVATLVATFVVSVVLESLGSKGVTNARKVSKSSFVISKSSSMNYMTLRKSVMGRNIFNSDGEFPDEKEVNEDKEKVSKPSVFDNAAECKKSKLKLTLVGTIAMGEKNSIAMIKEDGYSEADTYRVGDEIIGEDSASIVSISRMAVVLNNNGVKECLKIEEKNKDRVFAAEKPKSKGRKSSEGSASSSLSGECVVVQGNYVESELGEGFSKIISAARLVPSMEGNKVRGFKIFAISNASLLGKVGFKNGDIITQVNDVSMKRPDRGFALYEAFQDERNITVDILRKGKTPKTLCIEIK